MTQRMGFRFVSLSIFVALLTLWSPTPPRADTLKLANVPQSDSLALFVANDQGFFAKRGLTVQEIDVPSQAVIVSSIVSGSAELGFIVPPVLIQAKAAGIDMVVIAGGTQYPLPKPLYAGVLARTGSNIHSPADLVGKTVGVAGLNAFHHIMLRHWLTDQGIDPSRVKYAEIAFPQMADLMKAGQVDAIVTVDPFYTRMIDAGIGYSFGDYQADVPDGTAVDFYVAPQAWASGHGPDIAAFRAAIAEAIAFIAANDAAARASLAKWTKLPPAVVAASRIPNMNVDVAAKQIDWWIALTKQQGIVTSDVNAAEMFAGK